MARAGLSRLARRLLPPAKSGTDQWQRVALIAAVDRHIEALGPRQLSAVEISGDAQAAKPWREFTSLNHPEFDLCAALAEGHERYDVVVCEQVIEHVEDPGAAAANLCRLAVPGGHVIVSTPFLIRVHEEWGMRDYWRFTPRGLRTLLERAGLQVDEVGAWGNRAVVVGNFGYWPAARRWLPLRDERDLPVQVWAFARNPGP